MTDHAPLLERAFRDQVDEGSYLVDRIEGEVPSFVRGSYYLNGPARFRRGELRYRHWLDGDGMVCSLRFAADGIQFACRYVRSAKLEAEACADRPIYRTFGTRFPDDELVRGMALASPINVSAYPFAGSLLAFGEQGLPMELDPETLETRGEQTFGGRLGPLSPFSAHPKIDPNTGELFNFGVSYSRRAPTLHLYRFDAEGGSIYRQRHRLDFPGSVHDFALGPNHIVVYLSPYLLDMAALAGRGATVMESLSWEPERGSRLLVAGREEGELLASLPIDSRYCLHLANCFELNGRVHLDLLELDQPIYDQYQVVPELFTEVGYGRPVRYVLDPADWSVVDRQELDYALAPDFPAIDPRKQSRPADDFWLLGISKTGTPGRKFFDQLVHSKWSEGGVVGTYQAPRGHFLGAEPVFIGDPTDEGAGVVVCQQLDATRERSFFLLFDAFDLDRGPIAELELEAPVHLGFHACFERAA